MRDREIGIPRYAAFRELVGLSRPQCFADITHVIKDQVALKSVYATVDDVDLQVGMMAEPKREGWIVSDTAFQVFIVEASRRLSTDRFLSSDFRPEVYTRTGYDWVQTRTMQDLVLAHLPEIANQGLNLNGLFFALPTHPD